MSLPQLAAGSTATSVACHGPEGIADKDLYAVLNISPSADAAEIRAAYRRAVFTAHPDKGGTSETFNLITSAFNILSCPSMRTSYEQEQLRMKQDSCFSGGRGQKQHLSGLHSTTAPRADPVQTASTRLNIALQRLRGILQYMDKPLRDSLYSSIPFCVQRALLEFVQKSPQKVKELLDCREETHRKIASGCTRIGPSIANKSNAQLDIEHMRVYTCRVHDDLAIDHQFILANVRNCVVEASTADEGFWDKHDAVCQIFSDVLLEHGTSIEELGLRMYLEMRAPEWGARITSRVLPLAEAVEKRSQLLQARCTSWERLRAVWVDLIQGGRNSRSLEEAEKVVDQSRQAFLEAQELKLARQAEQSRQRLAQAVNGVEMALKHQESVLSKIKIKQTKRKAGGDSPKRQRSTRTASTSNHGGSEQTTWPYLDPKRLRAHTKACAGQ